VYALGVHICLHYWAVAIDAGGVLALRGWGRQGRGGHQGGEGQMGRVGGVGAGEQMGRWKMLGTVTVSPRGSDVLAVKSPTLFSSRQHFSLMGTPNTFLC